MLADFLIHNTGEVFTCAGPAPRAGRQQGEVAAAPRAVVASRDGIIVFIGPQADWRAAGRLTDDAQRFDAHGGAVVPGFVDPHTHLVFAGDRRHELCQRLAGASYAEIAASGGGIVGTVHATRLASEDQLACAGRLRLDEMLACGTTTCEVKSGYGLTTESELKMLRAIRKMASDQGVDVTSTFMGAHEIPIECRDRRQEYVSLVVDEMIPAVASERLAEWCDVFCETGVFTPEDARRILLAGKRSGLKPRIHADELGRSGGSLVAAEVGARSADHLIFVDADCAAALASANVVATLLPIASLYLKLGRFAPARLLIEQSVPVALATDINPGGGFSPSMPFAMTLACFAMGMTFEEALVAATINAAYSLDRHDRAGSLEPGKQMDAVVVDGPAIDLVRVGAPTISAVIKRGRVVVTPGGARKASTETPSAG